MSYQVLNESAAPSTPASGKVAIYADNTANPGLRVIDDAGNNRPLTDVVNFSTASQAPAAATLTYITGSALAVPVAKLKVGSMLRWRFNMTKTGAGVATSAIHVRIGTLGTTGDAAILTFTKPAGTAVIDEGWVEVTATVRSIGAAGVLVGEFTMIHNLAATGHMVIPCACVNVVSAGFDTTVANLIAGLTITTGAADAITIQMVQAELLNT